MLNLLNSLFDSDSLSPHGICLLWRPALMWTHVVADAVIGTAYLSIPLALASLVTKRDDIVFGWVFWCFVAFILLCGTTHFMSIVTLWTPAYGIEALVKTATAAVSIATAIALWPLLPRLLALPSQSQLRQANEALVERIAERDRALAALEEATADRIRTEPVLRQAQKMEAIVQLTGGVAHDFNTMLNIVVANLERVERQLPAGSPLLRPIRDAMMGAERAAAVTRKLLAFARNQPLRPREVDANAMVESLSPLLRSVVESPAGLALRLVPNLWPVHVDPNQLESALVNLVVNAQAAIPLDGRGRIEIMTVNLSAEDAAGMPGLDAGQDYVAVTVADSGTGMTEEVARRAFEPFFTTKPMGQGSGLGLSHVFGFVKQSGGHAAIESHVGRGTRVTLYLPRLAQGMATDAAAKPAIQAAPSSAAKIVPEGGAVALS